MEFEIQQPLEQIIAQAGEYLQRHNIEHSQYDAQVMLAHLVGIPYASLSAAIIVGKTSADIAGSVEEAQRLVEQFQDYCKRRAHHVPLQYIVGKTTFRYLQLDVGEGVFIPRPETEQLVEIALSYMKSQRAATTSVLEAHREVLTETNFATLEPAQQSTMCCVDLCAGSGAIGLSLVHEYTDCDVTAVEYSEDALSWTRKNAERFSAGGRYHLIHGDATDTALLPHLQGKVDVVVTNPPYIPLATPVQQVEVEHFEPHLALYGGSDDGLSIPEQIIDHANVLLKSGGLLVCEHDITQGEALRNYASLHGFFDVATVQDFTGRDRFLVAYKCN